MIGKINIDRVLMEKYDVIVVGAGAAGLMAANILCKVGKKVCMLEGRNRTGGRIHTTSPPGFSKAIEGGAEFIHGNLPLTLKLLKQAGIHYHTTSGTLWQLEIHGLKKREGFIEHADLLMEKLNELDHDMTIASFLDTFFSGEKYTRMNHTLRQYIEGYEAAPINDFSAFALKKEWESGDEEQYRIDGGYGRLIEYLEKTVVQNGSCIKLETVVKKINLENDPIEILTADNLRFYSDKIIITVPPAFLTGIDCEAAIQFNPALPVVTAAVKRIGYGGVIKIVLEFNHAFWESGKYRRAEDMFFIFSDQVIPTWWSLLPDKSRGGLQGLIQRYLQAKTMKLFYRRPCILYPRSLQLMFLN